MDKMLILNKIKEYYQFKNDTDFAKFLGISSQVYSNWKARNTYDAELIYTKCLDISSEWLLIGKGDMLKENNNKYVNEDDDEIYRVAEPDAVYNSTISTKEHCPFEPVCEMKKSRVFFENSNSLIRRLETSGEYQSKYIALLENYNTMLILFSKAHRKLLHLYFYARQHDDAKNIIDLNVAEKILHDMEDAEARLQHV